MNKEIFDTDPKAAKLKALLNEHRDHFNDLEDYIRLVEKDYRDAVVNLSAYLTSLERNDCE